MNQTHIHLLITHLPIVGTALGAFVLTHGIWKNRKISSFHTYLAKFVAVFQGVFLILFY
ncbi:hypothetical protein ACFJIV_11335 [Mucilaginibacter sp. UC70_90]